MTIIFEPLVSSPETLGTAVGTLPRLTSFGSDVPNYGIGYLPALTGESAGVYGERYLGDGLSVLPLIQAIGMQAAGGYGIGYLPPLQSSGVDNGALVPQGSAALGYLPALTSAGAGYRGLFGGAEPPTLRLSGLGFEAALGSETYPGWGIGYLPAFGGSGLQAFPTMTAFASLVPASPFIAAWAEEMTAYVTETPSATDSLASTMVNAIREFVSAADSLAALAQRSAQIIETLRLDDRLTPVLEAVLLDTLTAQAVLDGVPVRTVALIDSLIMSDAATGSINALALLSEALVVRDALVRVHDETITETDALIDLLDVKLTAMESLVSAAVCSDSVTPLAMLTVLVSESCVVEESLTPIVSWLEVIRESVGISVAFSFDGEPYIGICMNAATKGVTEFTNYAFNSLANFRGRLYGAASGGLYRLEGTSDDGSPIDAYLRTALQRPADGKQTRVVDAYLGYRSSGTLQLKVIVSGAAGVKTGYVYDLVAQPAGSSRAGRIKVGRGLKSAYWAFELGNVSGSDFALDVLEINPLMLDRRIP